MNNTCIKNVRALQIFDSRGKPTVFASVELAGGAVGTAAVPSGASTGIYEAHELRDNDDAYGGKGVRRAVANVNGELRDLLLGMDASQQQRIDRAMCELDGTAYKQRLGANAILSVSLACAHACAAAYDLPLYRWLGGVNAVRFPVPMMNILNGGAHAGNNVDIQEFMIVPHATGFDDTMRMATEIYSTLGRLLKQKGLSTTVGDEGGYAPDLSDDEQALMLICDAIEAAGYKAGGEGGVGIAIDAAASEWQDGEDYLLPKKQKRMSQGQLIGWFERLAGQYPIVSIEDPLGQEDMAGFREITQRLKGVQIVGDDLFVTNCERLRLGISEGAGNAILIKPNQIGTLSETLAAVRMAQTAGWGTIISHRSGETEDTTIADIAVGVNAGQIKTGAPARSDRVAKYNRLLAIEGMEHHM
ncbi:MAG: phosphopyruvate hydratase [Ruminococcaceae bacterium]|nr:phosphopyruvate hydratase [Oscillospiraceae bacterium]